MAKKSSKPAEGSAAYQEILAAIDQLLDNAEDDIAREALDPLAAMRAKCSTLTVALRVTLLALSCHGQKEDFAQEIAENLTEVVKLKDIWSEASDESQGQEIQAIGDNQEAEQEAEQEAT